MLNCWSNGKESLGLREEKKCSVLKKDLLQKVMQNRISNENIPLEMSLIYIKASLTLVD